MKNIPTSTICEDLAVIVTDELQTGRWFVYSSRVDEFVEKEECKRVNLIEVCDLSVFFLGLCKIGSFL